MCISSVVVGSLLALTCTRAQGQVTLDVEVVLNRPEAGGMLRLALCNGKEAFDSDTDCRTMSVAAQGRTVRCSFPSVEPGTYAVKVFHDVNGDGELNTSWIGWPKEPYGFSNDAPVNAGPPPYRLAAITVDETSRTARIRLR